MTEYEKLKKLLDEFGVGYEELEYDNKKTIQTNQGQNKVTGYNGFYTEFIFTEEGKFIEMGAWE
jgi:hypothetical protein